MPNATEFRLGHRENRDDTRDFDSGSASPSSMDDCDLNSPAERCNGSPGADKMSMKEEETDGLLDQVRNIVIKDRPFTVCVEGNIGSGKSTFLRHFTTNKNVELYPEPVAEWKNLAGYNTLAMMYDDPERWSCAFHSHVMLTVLKQHQRGQTPPVKMMERSLFSAKHCFLKNLHERGMMDSMEHALLSKWYDWIFDTLRVKVDLIVYLRSSPDTCYTRLTQRGRPEEAGVPLDYLQSLHDVHEKWLVHQQDEVEAPVLILDADQDFSDLQIDLQNHLNEILGGHQC